MENNRYDKLQASFEATQPQLPDDFTLRVMKRIEEQPSVTQTKHRWVWMYPAIATVAASLLLLWTLQYNKVEPEKGKAMKQLTAKMLDVEPLPSEPSYHGEESAGGLTTPQQRQGKTVRSNSQGRVSTTKPVAEATNDVVEFVHTPETLEQEARETANIVTPERQALADIYLAEAALQVAYRRQEQAEALRVYVTSIEEEETAPAQSIIAF